MPQVVKCVGGETLCTLAAANGFLNCDPLRADPANAAFLTRALKKDDLVTIPDIATKTVPKAVKTLNVFKVKSVPVPSLRFVHGSPDKPYKDDDTLTFLNVSNCIADKAGDNKAAFPKTFGFNKGGHSDPDTFKVEVVDPSAGAKLDINLEALRPTYAPDNKITGHIAFADAKAAQRKLKVTCEKVKTNTSFKGYRSRYLRLVVDDADQKALSGLPPRSDGSAQGLLVSDLSDGLKAAEDKVEILDQAIRATYVLSGCKAAAPNKCTLVATMPIGSAHDFGPSPDHKRVKVMVHVLKDGTGTATVVAPNVRKRVLAHIRQLYAQADMGVKLVADVREVPLPANLFIVANANGKVAVGAKSIQVRVRIDPAVDVTASITTTAGVNPISTANSLRDQLITLLPAGTKVVSSENPPLVGQTIGSADVLVGDPLTQTIRLNVITSDDVAHPVTVGRLTTTTVAEFGGADSHVGTDQERVLIKNYDTGSDRVDLFIVNRLGSGSLGEAFTPNLTSAATGQPIASMANSALIFGETLRKDDFFHTTVPHELGHLLMDIGHATPPHELMGAGSPVGANERLVKGPKRIGGGPALVDFTGPLKVVPVTRLRTANPGIVDVW